MKPDDLQVLIAFGRENPTVDQIAHASALIHNGVDWGALIRRSLHHRLTPLLYHNLNRLPSDIVDSQVMNGLADYCRANTFRNLQLTREAVTTVDSLASLDIPVAVLKGPHLALQIHGSVALRSFADIDVLVPADSIGVVAAALIERGYRTGRAISQAPVHAFFNPSTRTVIEVHTELGKHWNRLRLDTSRVWNRLEVAHLGWMQLPGLPVDVNTLFLAYHGCRHRWIRLGWLSAFADLISKAQETVDPSELYGAACDARMGRMFLTSLHLSRDLFGLRLGKPLNDAITSDNTQTYLARHVVEHCSAPIHANYTQQEGIAVALKLLSRITRNMDTSTGVVPSSGNVPSPDEILGRHTERLGSLRFHYQIRDSWSDRLEISREYLVPKVLRALMRRVTV